MSVLDTPIPDFDRRGQWRSMCRARQYHLQRLADEGHEITLLVADNVVILDDTFPVDLGNGWWKIGAIMDTPEDEPLPRTMRVYWNLRTDAVKMDKPQPTPVPFPPGCYGVSGPRPIRVDGNYRVDVDEGWRYWLDDVEYTPEQVRQLVSRREEVGSNDWRWERIEEES